ncbi:MAG TPA: hypothetical protein VFW44_03550 [Bryobacteraceae bacterium]|nr:hypothetical protein [Bryobacteraceae bacterium]
MKRFVFPLERVRRWREEQAELEKARLQQLYGQLAALEQEKASVEQERAANAQRILGQASVEGGELAALDAYGRHVRARVARIENRERQVGTWIEQQRQVVMEARRRAELLERLKAKKLEQWQAQADREEETLAGELFLAKWRR